MQGLFSRRPGLWTAAAGGTVIVAGLLSACSSIGLKSDTVEYRAAKPQQPLDVPPDLTPLGRDDRFQVPQTASAAGIAARPGPQIPANQVAPSTGTARIERAGTQRWLAVDLPPEQVYAKLKQFWQDNGLGLERDEPALGIAETVWAENQAKLPHDLIRRTLGRVLDTLYSTGEMDKFRSRVERTADNKSEVYISHRGMEEVFIDKETGQTRWQPRPSDPQLEAEMLQRLLLAFVQPAAPNDGGAAATVAAATTQAQPQVARLIKAADGQPAKVQIDEPFDRAWRRVGLALDRGGFTVEDRDRAKGLYFVRYLDPEYEARQREEQGLFSRLFGREAKIDTQQFRLQVEGVGTTTQVSVLDKEGKPDQSPTGAKILAQINEQLR